MCGVKRTNDVTSCIVCQMALWVHRASSSLGSWGLYISGSLGLGVSVSLCLCVYVSVYLRFSGSLDLWISGSLDLWISGTLDLWISGSLDLWISGSLVLWVSLSLCLCVCVSLCRCVSAAERIAVKIRDLKVFWSSAVGWSNWTHGSDTLHRFTAKQMFTLTF